MGFTLATSERCGMSKYFKKEEMQKFLADVISFKIWDYDEEINRDTVIKKLYEIPTIDIVRCKECIHCQYEVIEETLPIYIYCDLWKSETEWDSFCSYGERIDNE